MSRSLWIFIPILLWAVPHVAARAERLDSKPAERSAIAFEDIPIVIPLMPTDEKPRDAWAPRRTPTVTTADGQTVPASLVYIAHMPAQLAADSHDDGHGHAKIEEPSRAWIAQRPLLEVVAFEDRELDRRLDELVQDSAPGRWFLIVSPPSGVRLNGLMIDSQRFAMRPMSRNAYVPRREIVDQAGADWSRLRNLVEPLLLDPDERWRLRLLEDRVSPSAIWGEEGNPARTVPEASIEARAVHIEQRWRAALAIIHAHDEQTAIDLVRALTSVVRLPSGVVVPAWPVENDDHNQLLESILAPEIKPGDAARRARGYINSIAGACLTVLDDNQGTLALTEVRGQTLDCTVAGRRVRLAPFQTDISVIPENAQGQALSSAEVRAGAMRSTAVAMNGSVAVRPPGFRVGPLLEPWTLADWRSARTTPATGDRACAALVQRGPIGAGADVGGAAWQLYVECAASHAGPEPGDEVVLYLGGSVRIVDSGGTIRNDMGDEVGQFPTIFDHGRWWAIIPVPGDAVGPDGTLLVAMERRNASGWRATWPRPLLPGDDRPAPIRLDLSAWDGGIREP